MTVELSILFSLPSFSFDIGDIEGGGVVVKFYEYLPLS